MDSSAGAAKRAVGRLCQALALIMALFVGEQNLERVARALRIHPTAGAMGWQIALTTHGHARAVRVVGAPAGSGAAAAGLKPGDLVVPDHIRQWGSAMSTRVPLGFTLVRAGQARHLTITAAPLRGAADWLEAAMYVALLVYTIGGALLLLLSRARPVALLLGTALVAYSESTGIQPLLATNGLFLPLTLLSYAVQWATYILFLAFAVRLHELAQARSSLGVRGLAIAAGAGALLGLVGYVRSGAPLWFLLTGSGLVVALAILFDAWRRAYAQTRERYLILLIAFGVMVACQLSVDLEAAVTGSNGSVAVWEAIASAFIAPPLLAYAVLGQRVIDVGFAINRTLVYAIVSAILLVAFGLIEWGVEHLAPIEGREKNAFMDAALALGVFLTFHRVRDGVEHVVERVFFRSWQQREAGLKRFLRAAPFITRIDALAAAAAEQIRAYGDAPAAIYLADPDGSLRRIEGSLKAVPERLDANLAPLVALRADPKPLELEASDPFGATLLLPMVNRNALRGAILLGARPDGAAWRPDQVQLLGASARDIGQDLQALELDRLQSSNAVLSQEVAQLSRENRLLQSLRA